MRYFKRYLHWPSEDFERERKIFVHRVSGICVYSVSIREYHQKCTNFKIYGIFFFFLPECKLIIYIFLNSKKFLFGCW